MLKSLNATSKKFWSYCGLFGAAINSEFSQKVLPTAHYIVNLENAKVKGVKLHCVIISHNGTVPCFMCKQVYWLTVVCLQYFFLRKNIPFVIYYIKNLEHPNDSVVCCGYMMYVCDSKIKKDFANFMSTIGTKCGLLIISM